jgi:valyl-tRNA synthetase
MQDEEEAALFTSQKGVITTLTKGCKSVEVVRDVSKIPSGCGSTVLTSTISLHVLVRVGFFLLFWSGDGLTILLFLRA